MNLNTLTVNNFGYEIFETIKQTRDNDVEFWYASDLACALGYSSNGNYDHFRRTALKNAMNSCDPSRVNFEFRKVSRKSTSGQNKTDYELSLYACHLVAMSGNESKPMTRLARAYFSKSTIELEEIRRKERIFKDKTTYEERLNIREDVRSDMREMNNMLNEAGASAAYVHNGRYEGAYNGMNASEIKEHKNLPQNTELLNTMGPLELTANQMINQMTMYKMRDECITDTKELHDINRSNGEKVRQSLIDGIGVKLEELQPQTNVYSEEAKNEYVVHFDKFPKKPTSPFTYLDPIFTEEPLAQ